jgi:hypothetical protein
MSRRLFRFSLASLLGFITIAAPIFAYVGHRVRLHDRLDHLAIGAQTMSVSMKERGRLTRWIPSWCDVPVRLTLKGADASQLETIGSLKGLKELNLSDGRFSDVALEHLRELRHLDSLDLSRTRISGEGLVHLQELPLDTLTLTGCPLSETGMRAIARIESLRHLLLGDCGLTDQDVEHLPRLSHLAWLVLDDNTDLTAGAFDTLRMLPEGSAIDLGRTTIDFGDPRINDVHDKGITLFVSVDWAERVRKPTQASPGR